MNNWEYPYLTPNRAVAQTGKVSPTRIDIFRNPGGLFIAKWAKGWTASTPAYSRETNTQWAWDDIVKWLQDNGWIVRTWPDVGGRAWLGELMPVRSQAQIAKKRNDLTRFNPYGELLKVSLRGLDLRYDL